MEDNTEIITKPAAAEGNPTGGDLGSPPPKAESHIMNVSVRGIITMGVVFTICFMATRVIKVEEPLYSISFLTLGYYFGQGKTNKPNPH